MIKKLSAAIQNPVLEKIGEGTVEQIKGNPLARLIVRLWQTVVIVGGLALLIFLIWGAIDWLMSQGDPEKLKSAKNKIIHAMAGMALLAASYAIITLFKYIFGFDILQIEWPTP